MLMYRETTAEWGHWKRGSGKRGSGKRGSGKRGTK